MSLPIGGRPKLRKRMSLPIGGDPKTVLLYE